MTPRTQIGTTPKGTPVYQECFCHLCRRFRCEPLHERDIRSIRADQPVSNEENARKGGRRDA